MRETVVSLERLRKHEDYLTPENICFSDSCPASKEIKLKEYELLQKNGDIHIYKETIKQLRKSTKQKEEIKKGRVFLENIVGKFQLPPNF